MKRYSFFKFDSYIDSVVLSYSIKKKNPFKHENIKSIGMEVIEYGKTELNHTEYNVRSLCYVYQKRIK